MIDTKTETETNITASDRQAAITQLVDVFTDHELDREAFNNLSEPAIVVDDAGTIVRVNNEAEIFLGFKRIELLGKPVEVLVPHGKKEVHRDVHFPRYATYPQNRHIGSRLDLAILAKTGTEIPVFISLKPFVTQHGRYHNAVIRLKTEVR